ncbi:sensor histidine kinase [Pedosphaera parvula]|uniref:Histidine kinase n=1 Tax=Pedosphaera parvula (strain Ellin514) TaxID=320771 RepID=B9XB09_PEDPL|nr:sensor histidine kinase [Pedosphaera parvula]EEF63194.1 histidine kinase [Pedosphaera parvula Ellin514]
MQPAFSAEHPTTSSDYSFDIWETENGLPQNSITSIAQTQDGYLWLGTYNGLVRFDGVRFTVFDTSNTPGLIGRRITSLYEDAQKALWIGHETGDLTKYHNGIFSHIPLGTNWPGGPITGIEADKHGDLWLLSDASWLLCLKDNKGFRCGQGNEPGETLPSFAREKDGTLWVVRGSLFGGLEKREIIICDTTGPNGTNNFQLGCAAHDGGLWLVNNGKLVKRTPDGVIKDSGYAPIDSSVTTMLEARSGELLVGTLKEGIFLILPDGSRKHLSRQNGLSGDWIRSLREDSEGNLWVGTGGGGLDAFRRRKVEMIKAPDEWQGRALLSITPSYDGSLWVGTEGAGLYHLLDGKLTRYDQSAGLPNSFVWSLLEDRQHQLLVGTWGGGLRIREEKGFRTIPGLEDISRPMLALHQDRRGMLWIGTRSGLARYDKGLCTWFTRQEGLAVPDVRAITEDATGAIWFGMSGGGLGKIQDDKITQFHKSDGLANDFVWSLHSEPDGTLWIGTFGSGLCRLKQGKFVTISTREGLPNNVVCHIADDGHGNYWMSSYGGIFRVSREELNKCADGKQKLIHCISYGKADGLSTLECSGGFQPAGCKTPDGRLWFPTSKGLAVLDPEDVKINPRPPPVVIEEVTVDGDLIPLSPVDQHGTQSGLTVAPGKQRFEFRYTGLSFVAPDKVRFKYRLKGLESEWVDANNRRIAYYSYLKPGTYTFEATACNNDGVWNETGASLPLTILPQFWQTWWFTSGGVMAGICAVAGGARYATRRRLRQRMEKLERQRALERERARIAKDIHDDLGASLTRITMLSQSGRTDAEDPHQAAADLDHIYRTARELTKAMDEIVWAVSPQHDTLDSLVSYLGKFAQDFLSVAGIRCRLDVPIELPHWPLTAEVRHNLFLAFKEALNNVLKHAAATEVRVSLTLSNKEFNLFVADNGRGFDPKAPLSASADSRLQDRISSGNGLINMCKRLEEIEGLCEISSTHGEGTRIKFTVRIKK